MLGAEEREYQRCCLLKVSPYLYWCLHIFYVISYSIFSMYILMTTLQYALVFDFVGWTVFGLIWMLFPNAFLGIEFGEKN